MPYDWRSGASGAASGAATGTAILPGWGTAIGGALGALSGFGGSGNPADKARKELNQIPDTIKPYYQKYINGGSWAQDQLQSHYGEDMNDPNAIIQRLGSGYKESPGYQFRLKQGEGAINNANAAGGMLGSAQHEQQAGELAGDLANKDYQEYLNHALGLYGQGEQGAENLATRGYGASSDLATALANNLNSRAGLNYQGQENTNTSNSALMSGIMTQLNNKNNQTALKGAFK